MLTSASEVTARIRTGIPGRWAVGDGAYLQVAKLGERATASWLFRYWRDGQTVWVGLGPVGRWSASPKRATRRGRRASFASRASIRSKTNAPGAKRGGPKSAPG